VTVSLSPLGLRLVRSLVENLVFPMGGKETETVMELSTMVCLL
jgi:hypothetical protein